MIIDFHIHIFPDDIAPRAVGILANRSKLAPHTDGTAKNTIDNMKSWGVDKAVCLNIATKPSQQRKINSFIAETEKIYNEFIPFGTVHPDSESPLEEIEFIKKSQIKGIKLHPDYQDFYANDKKMYPLYSLMEELEIPLLFHTGYDIGLGCPIHCTPLMIKQISEDFPKLSIIAAHFGGNGMWMDALELLCHRPNVWFDTAFPLGLDSETATRLINKKGAEKILFASDCPWDSPFRIMEFIDSLGISDDNKELIYGKNAQNLLKIL